MHAVHGSNVCYLVSYTYLWSPMIYLVSWSPMLMPGLRPSWSLRHACLLGLPMVSYAYLCGYLPLVSYVYTLPPRPTWTPKPTYGLLHLPSLLSLLMVSYAYLCGPLCLPSLLSLLIVSYAYLVS